VIKELCVRLAQSFRRELQQGPLTEAIDSLAQMLQSGFVQNMAALKTRLWRGKDEH
jgi:hypothetical protein